MSEEVERDGNTDIAVEPLSSLEGASFSRQRENEEKQTGSREGDDVKFLCLINGEAKCFSLKEQGLLPFEFTDNVVVNRFQDEPSDKESGCENSQRTQSDDHRWYAVRWFERQNRLRSKLSVRSIRVPSTKQTR